MSDKPGWKYRLQQRAHGLKAQLSVVWYAMQDPCTGFWPKLLVTIALAYSLSPIDLIPDFIPILGLLDDLILVPALLALAIRLIPATVLGDARAKAEAEPVHLSKKPAMAVLFVLLWLVVIVLLIRAFMPK